MLAVGVHRDHDVGAESLCHRERRCAARRPARGYVDAARPAIRLSERAPPVSSVLPSSTTTAWTRRPHRLSGSVASSGPICRTRCTRPSPPPGAPGRRGPPTRGAGQRFVDRGSSDVACGGSPHRLVAVALRLTGDEQHDPHHAAAVRRRVTRPTPGTRPPSGRAPPRGRPAGRTRTAPERSRCPKRCAQTSPMCAGPVLDGRAVEPLGSTMRATSSTVVSVPDARWATTALPPPDTAAAMPRLRSSTKTKSRVCVPSHRRRASLRTSPACRTRRPPSPCGS